MRRKECHFPHNSSGEGVVGMSWQAPFIRTQRMPFKERWSNQLMGTSPILEARECRPYQEVRWQAKQNSRGRLSTKTFTLHLENQFRLSRVTWSIVLVLFGKISSVCCPVVKGRGQNLGLELVGYIQWMKGTDATNPLSSWGQLYAFPAFFAQTISLYLAQSLRRCSR